MADSKITGLAAGTCKKTDLHVAVDTTDTSMAPSGTDKKYTLEQIVNFNVVKATSISYQTQGENIILCNAPSITITLATTDASIGKVISIVDSSDSASFSSPITIVGQAGETINGFSQLKITVAGGAVTLTWDGAGWNTVGIQNLSDRLLFLFQASNGAAEANAPTNYIYRSSGTSATPLAVNSNDRLYTQGIYGYDGSSFVESARFQFSVGQGSVTTGIVPSSFEFDLTNYRFGGGALSTAFKMDQFLNATFYDKIRLANDSPTAPFDESQLALDSGSDLVRGNGISQRFLSDTPSDACISLWGRARGILGTPTAVQDGDYIYQNQTYAFDGTNWVQNSEFRAEVNGTVGTGTLPVKLSWSIMKDGASTLSEEMFLTSLGHLNIGVTTSSNPGATGKLYTQFDNTDVGAVFENVTSTSPTLRGSAIAFARARGTPASKSNVLTGDIISQLKQYAYNDGGYLEVGEFLFKANGTVIAGKVPTKAELYIFPDDGTVPVLTHTWDSDLIQYATGQFFVGVTNTLVAGPSLGMVFAQFDETKSGASFELISSTDADIVGSSVVLYRARGTPSSRADVQNDDVIAEVIASGYNNSIYRYCGKLGFTVDGVPSAGDLPTRAELYVFKSGVGNVVTHTWNNNLTQTLEGAINFKYLGATTTNSNQAQIIGVDTSGGATTVTLLTADVKAGRAIRVFDKTGNAGTNAITIDTQGSELINGAASITINYARGGAEITSDGTNWFASYTIASSAGVVSPLTTKGDLYTYSTTDARLAVGSTNGQILQVSSGAATGLAWSTATYPATTTINRLLYSSANDVVGQVSASNGSVLVSNNSGVPTWSSTMSDGQIIIGTTGGAPVAANVTAGAGISVNVGPGTLEIASTITQTLNTNVITLTSLTLSVNQAYYANNAALVTFTLPTTLAVGDVIEVGGLGAGGWRLSQNSGQQIVGMDTSETTSGSGGYLSSTGKYNFVALRCIVANTTLAVISMSGNINFN